MVELRESKLYVSETMVMLLLVAASKNVSARSCVAAVRLSWASCACTTSSNITENSNSTPMLSSCFAKSLFVIDLMRITIREMLEIFIAVARVCRKSAATSL